MVHFHFDNYSKPRGGHSMADPFIITCCFLFALYILCIAVSEGAFRYSNRRYKWIQRESRLLGALKQDVDEVSELEYETTQNGHQLLDSENGRTVRVLNGWEESWITTAKKVIDEANWCFQKLTKRRALSFPKWFLLVVLDLVPMVRATLRMNKLDDFLGKKEYDVDLETNSLTCLLGKKKIGASDIYRSLESSRSRTRSLQDRSEDGEIKNNGKSITIYCLKADALNSSLQHLIDGNPHLMRGMDEQIKSLVMHSKLLSAFMKDLKQLRGVETEMEKSWVMEAHETIMEAKLVLETINATANKRRWVSIFSDRLARWKLQKDIMSVSTWISGLLETKERYGFKFVRRDSSKSALRTPHHQIFRYQTTDDMDLLFAVNKIHNWLNQLQGTSDMLSQANSLSEELDHMHKLFKDTKATEDYAINLRNACLEQLKKTAGEVENLSEIHRIMDVVGLLQRCLGLYSIEVRVESLMSVVGLEEDVHELVFRLTTESGSRSIISIVGMDGIGKTTLARKIFNHSIIKNSFAIRRWVSVPAEVYSDENELLTIVGKKVLETQEEGHGKDYLIKKVKDLLKEKRCLLVFDRVSSNKAMFTLKKTFREMMTDGSRILLTTCNKAIASNADQNCKPHQLRLRTKEESWEIFTQMVDCPPEMETFAKRVVGRGGGLPIAILRLGYRMLGKKVTSGKLSRELECMTLEKNQTAWSSNVKVNEEVLRFHPFLSRCFSYFKRFPRDTEIPARRIVSLWIAQGLVQLREDEKRTFESDAYEHLMEFIGRNLIQVVQRKPNGKVKTCCLPTSVLDYLLEGECKINTSNAHSWSSRTTSSDGQLAFHFHKDNDDSSHHNHGLNINLPNFMQSESYHQSYLIFTTEEGGKPSEEGETLCRGLSHGFYIQLQVLDLERVFRPQLPETIGKLKQLTYLGLRRTYLGTIPASIGNLVNLLTLDLKHTHLRTLPSSMWKLKKIRHLYLNQNCQMPQPTAIHMKNLRILSGVFVDKINLVKDRLDKLISLRKLGLTFQVKVAEQKVLESWIKKLIHLESLKLTIKDKSSRVPQHLNLECIKDLNKLSSLHLSGRLDESTIEAKLPQSLTHLTLSASGIRTDPMSMLGKLPNLKWLKLNSDSYYGTDMVCSKNEFPRLLVLRLWNLDTLKKLDVQEGSMINLMELEIKSCRNLTITTGLEHLKNLQKHRVY